VQCVTQARASLLADALRFIVPHWIDEEHGVVERPNDPSSATAAGNGAGAQTKETNNSKA
jgi:hypothetical protein